MDREDPLTCWHLFTYAALLNESRYLARPVKMITAALNSSQNVESINVSTTSTTPEIKPYGSNLIFPTVAYGRGELLERMVKALESPSHGDLDALYFSLTQLETDVTKALDIVNSTINMVFSWFYCTDYFV